MPEMEKTWSSVQSHSVGLRLSAACRKLSHMSRALPEALRALRAPPAVQLSRTQASFSQKIGRTSHGGNLHPRPRFPAPSVAARWCGPRGGEGRRALPHRASQGTLQPLCRPRPGFALARTRCPGQRSAALSLPWPRDRAAATHRDLVDGDRYGDPCLDDRS